MTSPVDIQLSQVDAEIMYEPNTLLDAIDANKRGDQPMKRKDIKKLKVRTPKPKIKTFVRVHADKKNDYRRKPKHPGREEV